MPNPFEKDWTKPEGHEIYDIQDPSWGKWKDETPSPADEKISPGTSGGVVFTLGKDGVPPITDVKDWVCGSPSEPSSSERERIRKWYQELMGMDLVR